MNFAMAVWRLVRRIPAGRVTTYGEIAARLGRPRGARAVGHAMRHCPSHLPWHRVVNARGGISPRARASGMLTQRIRLEHEGVSFENGRVPLRRYGWHDAGPRRHDRQGHGLALLARSIRERHDGVPDPSDSRPTRSPIVRARRRRDA